MASGMDMLLNAVIKSLGVNPQDFVQYLSQFVNGVNTKLTDFENRLAQMEQNLDELTSTNRTILLLLQKKETSNVPRELFADNSEQADSGPIGYSNGHGASRVCGGNE